MIEEYYPGDAPRGVLYLSPACMRRPVFARDLRHGITTAHVTLDEAEAAIDHRHNSEPWELDEELRAGLAALKARLP